MSLDIKFTISLIAILLAFSIFHAKNFNLDASSDALIFEGDKDLKFLREVNDRYGSKDFLVLTYTPVSSFVEKETVINLQLLKSKIEKLNGSEIIIWTTTPWTIPANKALAYNEKLKYLIIKIEDDSDFNGR